MALPPPAWGCISFCQGRLVPNFLSFLSSQDSYLRRVAVFTRGVLPSLYLSIENLDQNRTPTVFFLPMDGPFISRPLRA